MSSAVHMRIAAGSSVVVAGLDALGAQRAIKLGASLRQRVGPLLHGCKHLSMDFDVTLAECGMVEDLGHVR